MKLVRSMTVAIAGILLARGGAVQIRGTFSVLSYNIAGLPEPLSSSNPVNNTPIISSRVNQYDIVHVQEDFAYHDLLLKEDKHPFQTKTTGNVPYGSGLNTLSQYPFSDLKRITWAACWIGDGDCLTPKGFTSMRVNIAPGVMIDMYNLHGEAGNGEKDSLARRLGFQQLRKYLDAESTGQPVILFGDTNCRYTAKDPILRLTEGDDGLTDVWVQLLRGGSPPESGTPSVECPFPNPNPGTPVDTTCELIDKILYRSSPLVRLNPQQYLNEDLNFLAPSGGSLSDHYPVTASFTWELNPVLRAGADYVGLASEGANEGKRFSDLPSSSVSFAAALWESGYITELELRSGLRLDALSYTINNGEKKKRGGCGGLSSSTLKIDVANKETVTYVEACEGPGELCGSLTVVYFRVQTSLGQSAEAGEKPLAKEGRCSVWRAPGEGWTLVGFQGRAGKEVESLGVLWGKVF
ncbi:endonuclease/Exonuclease/phosphatase [Tirmania nivea]|nr:endonuclease/Exonuclease/phosphatase [Tirmania nivea]